jgi:hypothetical protein
VHFLYVLGTIIGIATRHNWTGWVKVLASVSRVNLIQYMIILSSSVGHRGVITRSVPNPCEQSYGLLSTTRISYSCKTGKRETDKYSRIIYAI